MVLPVFALTRPLDNGVALIVSVFCLHLSGIFIGFGLIHPASAGHGPNLQSGGNILVWFGLTWSLELYQQTIARLWRQGQSQGTVSVIHIVTDGTVDERILKALEQKDSTQAALIDAVKAEVADGK